MIVRLAAFYGIQVLVWFAAGWFMPKPWTWSRLGIILFPSAIVFALIIQRAYRRALAESQNVPRIQFNLLMLFVFVTAICLWLGLVRLDRLAALQWHAQRTALETEAMDIVGQGKVRFSGNEDRLMVVVGRKNFGDEDLYALFDLMGTTFELFHPNRRDLQVFCASFDGFTDFGSFMHFVPGFNEDQMRSMGNEWPPANCGGRSCLPRAGGSACCVPVRVCHCDPALIPLLSILLRAKWSSSRSSRMATPSAFSDQILEFHAIWMQ